CYDALRAAAKNDKAYAPELQSIDAFNASINLPATIAEIAAALTESGDGIRQVRDIVLVMNEFAHPGAAENEATDINRVIDTVVKLSRNRQSEAAEVVVDLALDPPKIMCRRGQIQQVILNIVVNAMDAIDDMEGRNGRILISTHIEADHLVIRISDNGAGVPDDLREKIFDPFFTTKPVGKGTGQGLALAKDCIVKTHNGRLRLVDLEGFATTFQIDLPLSGRAAEEKTEPGDAFAA
ncbi:MAG: ATP-binding protein, partial [Pseudomonadota bacterium]